MNQYSRTREFSASRQTTSGGKLSDMQRILKLAVNSFGKGKYSLAIDYCRKAVNLINGCKEPAAEAYYIWCLSCLKLHKTQEARNVCYDARLKLGNYLDLVYFEIVIAAINNELDKIPRFAEKFMELYEKAGGKFNRLREKANAHIGDVLLLAGMAYEKSKDKSRADDYFQKYLSIFPDDESALETFKEKRIDELISLPEVVTAAAAENIERMVPEEREPIVHEL
jgi:tetratricopeptide (TPR) repeat protein